MGVQGLLPQLRSITRRKHVSSYAGKTVAIDGYVLLHRGAYSCARELVEGLPTDKYVTFCLNRVDVLARAGVIPLLVFDGGPMPNKSDEEATRGRSRAEHRERAQALWRAGNRTAALEAYQKAVDVTPEMAHAVALALRTRGVRCITAPYEADAQMAYLALNNMVDAVVTEDSDLLAYGCPAVLFKLDANGDADEVLLADLPCCRELNFAGWTHDLFQQLCVFAGCDFLKGLPGIGIKKAHAQLRRTRDFMRALRSLRFDGVKVPPGFEARFQRALWTFRHQRVYCPRRREVVHLTEPPGGSLEAGAAVPGAATLVDDEPDFLGPPLPVHVAQGVAEGRLHPVTFEPLPQQLLQQGGVSGRSEGPRTQGDGRGSGQLAAATQVPALPPVDISAEARQKFKKPRLADEAGGLSSSHPTSKPRPRLPAALTAKRYFPTAPPASAAPSPGDSLRTSLQKALMASEAPEVGAEPPEEEEEEEDAEAPAVAAALPPPRLPARLPLGAAGPLWKPKPCFTTPAAPDAPEPTKSPLPGAWESAGCGPGGAVDDTPGFYAAHGTEEGTGPPPTSVVPPTELKGTQLDFLVEETEEQEEAAAAGAVQEAREPLIDLSHLPSAKADADTAVQHLKEHQQRLKQQRQPQENAAGDSGDGGAAPPAGGSVFDRFALKK